MTTYFDNDYSGTLGNIGTPGSLDADTLTGTPEYVSGGGHDGLPSSVEFEPGEYASYQEDFGDFVSVRGWITTPASSDGAGNDWVFVSFTDSGGNFLCRAAINPNGKWKCSTPGVSNITAGSADWGTLYGFVYEYNTEASEPYQTLRIHDAGDDSEIVEIFQIGPSAVPTNLRIGNVLAADAALQLSDVTAADFALTIGDPPPATTGLIGARVGPPRVDGFQVTTYTGSDVPGVRLRVQNVAGHTLFTTTSEVTPDSFGYATHTVTGATAATEYEYRVESVTGGVGTLLANPWTGTAYLGPILTAPVEGTDSAAFRFAGEACAHRQPQSDAYDKIMARDPAFTIGGGDQNYADRVDPVMVKHLEVWEASYAIDSGQAELAATRPKARQRSDHDGGEGGNKGAGSPGTIAALAAILTMHPVGDILYPGTLATSFRYGRHTFIFPDFRSEYRTAHDAPLGSRTAYGIGQLAALVAKIHEAGQRGDMIWFCSDPIVLGDSAVLLDPPTGPPKFDALPNYPTDLGEIAAALAWYPTAHAWLQADYHALGYKAAHPLTGGPVFSYAGTITQFGNMRDPESYDEVFEGDGPGSRGNVFFDFDVSAITDDVFTLDAHGWDAAGNVEVISATHEFDLSDPAPIPPEPPILRKFLFNGNDMSTLATGVEQVRPSSPAMIGSNATIPYWDGTQWNAFKTFDEVDVTFEMRAYGANDDGTVPDHDDQRALCRANLDALTRIFASPNLVEIKKRFGDEYRVIYGQVVNRVDFSIFDERIAKFAVTFRCPHPFWRDEIERTESVPYDFAEAGLVTFPGFAGATARAQRGVITAHGQLKEPTFYDGVTYGTAGQTSFQYDGTIQSTKKLTVDLYLGTAIKDAENDPEDPPTDEIELIKKFEGGPLVTLNPDADGAYSLWVSVTNAPGQGAEIEFTGYRWYVLHG